MTGLVTDARVRACALVRSLFKPKIFAVLALIAAQLGASFAAQAEIVQQGNRMIGSGGSSSSQQGFASAISGDGTTAIVGGHGDASHDGAVWIYTRSGATWSQQGNKLVGTGAIGEDAERGWSVAISHDGNTVAAGGPYDNGNVGAVWIFVRDNMGNWSQQQKLVGSGAVGGSSQGRSVALSRDGNTVIFGGPSEDSDVGAAWVFTRTGTSWTPQGPKLRVADINSSNGESVALSADGNTALIGGFWGAAAFVRSGDTWSQQSGTMSASLPSAVALSNDGNTAVLGDPVGSGVTVYTRSGGVWSDEPAFLSGSGAVPANPWYSLQGQSVSVSADGNTLVFGAPTDNNGLGAIWVFTRSGGEWTQLGSKIAAPPDAEDFADNGIISFGSSVGISADGNRIIAGGVDNYDAAGNISGAAWMFVQTPGISQITPDKGPATGGQMVTIFGSGFTGVDTSTGVTLDGVPLTSVSILSPTEMTGVTPAHTAGVVELSVTNSVSTTSAIGAYTYADTPTVDTVTPGSGPAAGGTSVTITGTGFTNATTVDFGGAQASSFSVDSATQITATTSAHAGGAVDVSVTTPGGTAAKTNAFTYIPPAITSISPGSGPAAGGTSVTITGTGFTGVTAVTFGATPATGFTVDSATQITATSPAGTGTVDVTVTTGASTSATSSADRFTYVPAPVVTSVSPTSGPTTGGTTVIITGTNLGTVNDVEFGAANATSFTSLSNTRISAVTPAGTGSVTIRVSTAGGTHNSGVTFTYVPRPTITAINPNQGPAKGGTQVSIVGTNLTGATAVRFNSVAATSFSVTSSTTATAVSPAGTAGLVNVNITTPGGTSAASVGARFTYTPNPTMKVIAKFVGGVNDGGKPFGALVADKKGALYGTTSVGGNNNKGVIFKLVPAANPNAYWIKTILHEFDGTTGATPYAGLVIDNAGNLYGTTTAGGTNNKGVVFKYTATTKQVTVLYSFKGNATDGGVPYAGLARDADGVLYGFTSEGGRSGFGTAFKIAPNNPFTVTHHFNGTTTGDNPRGAPVLDKQGNVYGATVDGKAASQNGLVFKIAPNNARTTLYAFKAPMSDGHHPYGPLFTPGGTGAVLFGTTNEGGAQNKGAIFDVMRTTSPPTGIMLYAFTGASGANPFGGVVGDARTILYGTTFNGGAQNRGVVFRLIPPANNQPKWTHELMYSFRGGNADGANPYAGVLLGKNSTLYGTTSAGGGGACAGGCGNAYRVTY